MKNALQDTKYQDQFDTYWSQFDAVGIEFAYMMESHSRQYFNWWQKIEDLIAQAKYRYPVEFIIDKKDRIIPVNMPKNNSLSKNEEILRRTNNFNHKQINKSFSTEQNKNIPLICSEIYPSDINVIEDALILRLDLLANWTSAIKEIDGVLMQYIGHILEYWRRLNIDISLCQGQLNSKNDIFESLTTIESLLNNYWTDSPQLKNLQNQIFELKKELENLKNDNLIDDTIESLTKTRVQTSLEIQDNQSSYSSLSSFETFILQKRAINILISKYKELHKNWEFYKFQVENATNLSSISERINRQNKVFPSDLSKSEKSLSFSSAESQSIWSKYIESQTEKQQSQIKHSFDKYPLINVSPQKLELISKRNVYDIKSGLQNSRIDISVPGEKEMRFFQNKPISIQTEKRVTSSIDISHYFTRSLLPNQQQIKLLNYRKINNNPTVGNDITTINYRNSILQRSKSTYSRLSSHRTHFNRSNTLVHSDVENFEKININKNRDSNKSYFVVLNLPRIDKISNILDKKRQKLLTATQAKADGLCDDTFLEILDTDSKIKYSFRAAIVKGLVFLKSKDNNKLIEKPFPLNEENFTKEVYKIDEILDPDQNVWVSVKDAIGRNVLNQHSGLVKINSTEYQHIAKVINSPNVRGRRIYHCNAKSLPPEMTIEISRIF